jgi:hypothetical protein
MSLLTELVAFTLPNYKDFAPTERAIRSLNQATTGGRVVQPVVRERWSFEI